MITRLGLAPRHPSLDVPAFVAHWSTEHAAAALAIPGLLKYTQNHPVLRDGRHVLPYPGFDVCAETQFESLDTMDEGFRSPAYLVRVQEDEAVLIDKPRFCFALAERRVLADGDPGESAVKLLTFFRSHPNAGPQALADVAGTEYAEAVALSRPLRHEQLVTIQEAHRGRAAPACDLVDLLWFAAVDDALAHLDSEAAHRASYVLAGRAFGCERLIARPVVVR
jgi:hypothetical protein